MLAWLWTEAHQELISGIRYGEGVLGAIQARVLRGSAIDFYDWIGFVHHGLGEFAIDHGDPTLAPLSGIWSTQCNERFEQHKAAWRFIRGELCPVSGPEEIESLENAHEAVESSDKLEGCRTHYRQALSCFAGSDYANTGKEAISALESLAQVATGRNKTLGQLTDDLVSLAGLHVTHGAMISKLYVLTSDAGYRHALKEGQTPPTEAEARFILVTVSAYLNLCIPALRESGNT